eukprot:168336-Pyramimonas_sp.AAC.1
MAGKITKRKEDAEEEEEDEEEGKTHNSLSRSHSETPRRPQDGPKQVPKRAQHAHVVRMSSPRGPQR